MGFPSGQEDVNFMAGTTAHGRPVSFSYKGCATVPVKVDPFLTGLDEGLIRRFVSFVYEGSLSGTAEKKPLPFAREGRDVLVRVVFSVCVLLGEKLDDEDLVYVDRDFLANRFAQQGSAELLQVLLDIGEQLPDRKSVV